MSDRPSGIMTPYDQFWCIVIETFAQVTQERDQYKDENKKMKKLVADMWRGAMQRMDYAERFSFAGDFVDKIRELKIKVDK